MSQAILDMVGKPLYDTNHRKVGTIDNIYVDRHSEQPVFASVLEGLFNRRVLFVPVNKTRIEGDTVVADTTKELINEAPEVKPGEALTHDEEQALFHYYGSDTRPQAADDDRQPSQDTGVREQQTPAQSSAPPQISGPESHPNQ